MLTCPYCRIALRNDAPLGQAAWCPECRQALTVSAQAAAPVAAPPGWYVLRQGKQGGPFAGDALRHMVSAQQLLPGDLVWREGMPDWADARSVPELQPSSSTGEAVVMAKALAPSPRTADVAEPVVPRYEEPAFWPMLWIHLRRAFAWNLAGVPVTPAEQKALTAQDVHHQSAQRYLVWRRSIFLMVSVATCVSVLLHIISMIVEKAFSGLSGFGVFLEIVRLLSQLAMPAAAILACVFWARVRLSRLLMVLRWSASFAVPLAIALFPVHWLVNVAQENQAVRTALGIVGAIVYFALLMPTVLAILPGVLRASVRLKTLLPESIITGWFLVASVPLYALLLLVTFITINQLAGNALLILGILLFMGAPLAYLALAARFTRPLTKAHEVRSLTIAQIVYTLIAAFAVILLVAYLFTGKLLGDKTIMGFSTATSVFLPWRLIQFYIEFTGRSLFTSALVVDLLLLMNHSVWHHMSRFAGTEHAKQYDQVMDQLGRVLRRP
jgi:hypothetical protein